MLGLPNKQKCEEFGIKPFVAKIPKDETDDSKGKGKKKHWLVVFDLLKSNLSIPTMLLNKTVVTL